jgi:hypothetical protein
MKFETSPPIGISLVMMAFLFVSTIDVAGQAYCGVATAYDKSSCFSSIGCSGYTVPVPYRSGQSNTSWIPIQANCLCKSPNLWVQGPCINNKIISHFQEQYSRPVFVAGEVNRRPLILATSDGETVVLGK